MKPTIEKIQSLYESRKALYANLRTEQETDQKYYEGSDLTGIQKPYHEVRTGKAKSIVKVPVHRLLGQAQDESQPRKHTKDEEDLCLRRKLFINTFLDKHREDFKEALEKAFLRGEGWLRVLYDPDSWSKEPEVEDGEGEESYNVRHDAWELATVNNIPIVFDSPDSMNMWSSRTYRDGVPHDVIVAYDRNASEIADKWVWDNSRNRGGDETVLWVEYWSRDWRAFFADWEPVWANKKLKKKYSDGFIPNVYKFVPFVRILSSFGLPDSSNSPESEARGILYSARSRLTALDRLMSFADSYVALHSHRTGKIKVHQSTPDAVAVAKKYAADISGAPGEIPVEMTDKFEHIWDDPPSVNQGLYQQLNTIDASLESDFHTNILSGYAPTHVQSGFQQGIGISWARADYEDAIRNLEKALSTAVGMVLRIIETVIKKPITIRVTIADKERKVLQDVVISPDDIEGFYTVDIKFRSEDATREDMKFNLGMEAWKAGALSLETALGKFMGFEDPRAEMKKLEVERFIKENPMIQSLMAKAFAKEWGVEEELLAMQQEQAMMAQTPPPPGGGAQTATQSAASAAFRTKKRGAENPELSGAQINSPIERTGSLVGQ